MNRTHLPLAARALLTGAVLSLGAAGCTRIKSPVEDIEVSAVVSTEIPTVAEVTWAPTEGASIYVEWGLDTTYDHVVTPGPESTSVVLVGAPPDTDIHFRLVVDDGVETWVGEDHVVHTGARPEDLPELVVTSDDASVDWGSFILVPLFEVSEGRGWLLLVDRAGEIVWWQQREVFAPSAFIGRDGGVMYRTEGGFVDFEEGGIYRADWMGENVEQLVVDDMGHHDFMELADGTLVAIEYDVRPHDGVNLMGDRLVEYAPDGTAHEVWNSWDTLTPPVVDGDSVPSPIGTEWTHVNGVDYDPVTDRYLLSFYFDRFILAIDRSTGAIAWQLGGADSDWKFVDDPGFGPQHAPTWVDGGVLLFDNHETGVNGEPSTGSRAVRYELDEVAGTAAPVWEHTPAENSVALVLGDVAPTRDGNVLISTGVTSDIQVVSEEGDVLFSMKAPAGLPVGRGVVVGADLLAR